MNIRTSLSHDRTVRDRQVRAHRPGHWQTFGKVAYMGTLQNLETWSFASADSHEPA